MFNKIFNKSPNKNQAPAELVPEPSREIIDEAAWKNKLQKAIGNDTELLALAIDAKSIDHKLACIQALASEETLKIAEREFRKHDRRVHSLAKQRYETLVKMRETRTSAGELIQAATALLEAPIIPANRLVELNQAWELLPHALIDDEDKFRFVQLKTGLSELIRERGERKRLVSRWMTAARQALEGMSLACASVAVDSYGLQEIAAMLATTCEKARATLATMPAIASPTISEDDALAALGAAIQSSLQDAALIEARLAILGELQVSQASQPEVSNKEISDAPPTVIPVSIKAAATERWNALPPLADTRITSALNVRFDACFHLQNEARKKLQQQKNLIASEKDKAVRKATMQTLMAAADAAESALAAGQLAEAGKQLAILQKAADKGFDSAALLTRIGVLQSEHLRLKGWQHWGGGRVRDDLAVEAEALAASTVAPEGSPPVKLQIKKLDDSIGQLRERWKELDRLGGATSKLLWERFDTALKTAYLPVAEHQAKLKEARQENLAARKKLLDVLDALNMTADEQNDPDWKEINRALAHFQTEWRKLGPVEHAVPHKAQPALLERMKASIARLEEPLKEVQASAQAEREQLIVRASALGQDVQNRDMMAKLRDLQTQWQSHAKSMPLPRKIENTLWAEFKTVTDALMSQREAAFSARDAELKSNQVTRESLITRLEELHQDIPSAEIKRVLASVDAEWRKAGEAPKNNAAKLESRYRAAREQAQQHIAGSARRAWQLACDALVAKLALCEELESTNPSSRPSEGIEARWQTLPALPSRWEQALQARYKSDSEDTVSGKPARSDSVNNGEPLDHLLLQLESALEIPSPAALQASRQTLKLLAMKNAMEGRKSATPAWPEIEKMTEVAIGYTHLSPDQHSRLKSIIAAIRNSGPRSM